MSGFVDLHQHVMFDMDDGAPSFGDTKNMIAASCADGVAHVFATPHVQAGRCGFELSAYRDRLKRMSDYCEENGLPITLHPGAEILYNGASLRAFQTGEIPTLGDSCFVLVEFYPDISFGALSQAVRLLSNAGYTPVVAHIERYECLVKDPACVRELKELYPVRLQVNCSTIIKPRHFRIRRFICGLLRDEGIDYVATDAHDTRIRPTCMRACHRILEARCGVRYADRVTGLNQQEIFA